MASDESMTLNSSVHEDDETDDGFDHSDHRLREVSLSRLSICTTEDDYGGGDEQVDDQMRMYMSTLSIDTFDADLEFFGGNDLRKELLPMEMELNSESDEEAAGCYSLPETPPRRRNRSGIQQLIGVEKDYASENEALGQKLGVKLRRRRRRVGRESRNRSGGGGGRGGERSGGGFGMGYRNYGESFSGESEGGGGVVMISRPKGGNRSLCMDLEEVKACRDLGFELEHERMLEFPSRVSLSASTLDSGGNSPIANWRISSPGDDPRDVKARLKVWAQAVALASASSRHSN